MFSGVAVFYFRIFRILAMYRFAAALPFTKREGLLLRRDDDFAFPARDLVFDLPREAPAPARLERRFRTPEEFERLPTPDPMMLRAAGVI